MEEKYMILSQAIYQLVGVLSREFDFSDADCLNAISLSHVNLAKFIDSHEKGIDWNNISDLFKEYFLSEIENNEKCDCCENSDRQKLEKIFQNSPCK